MGTNYRSIASHSFRLKSFLGFMLVIILCSFAQRSDASEMLLSAEISSHIDRQISEQKSKLNAASGETEKTIIFNNIGLLLLKSGRLDDAYYYFNSALSSIG